MNKLQLFARYYITEVERGMDQSLSRGIELHRRSREGVRRFTQMRSSFGEE